MGPTSEERERLYRQVIMTLPENHDGLPRG